MLGDNELKIGLQSDLSQKEKLLLLLAAFDHPTDIQSLKRKAGEVGLRISKRWNPSARLGQALGLAILTSKGWEITNAGRDHLRKLGFGAPNAEAIRVASDLRLEMARIKNATTRAFVEEAVKCYEANLFRSSIVMSWMAAVDVLYYEVIQNHLAAFNAEMVRLDPKWKPAKTADDLSRLKESEFLERLVAISVIGKNVKAELKACLDRRNGCGHPNSLQIGTNTVAHHLEILLLNVFQRYG